MANINTFYPSIVASATEGPVTGDLTGNVITEIDGATVIVVDNDAQTFLGDLMGDVTGTLTGNVVGASSVATTALSVGTITATGVLNSTVGATFGGTVAAPQFDGLFNGDVQGDVLDDDSNVIVDAGNAEFKGSADTAFNSNTNETTPITFWAGTQAEYDAIDPKDNHTLYLIH